MKKRLIAAAVLAAIAPPATAQDEAPKAEDAKPHPSPGQIVDSAKAEEWIDIKADDLLVMDLVADAQGNARRVIIQLMPPPFSQGWVNNIRKLAQAKWYDGIAITRVQDNYVVQWGDPNAGDEGKAKLLPEGLEVVSESAYEVDGDTLSEFTDFREIEEPDTEEHSQVEKLLSGVLDPNKSEKDRAEMTEKLGEALEAAANKPTGEERLALISIESTQTPLTSQGWHERDGHAHWVEFWKGWPLGNFIKSVWENEDGQPVARPANTQRHILEQQKIYENVEENKFWPVHCYGMIGVGRGMSPNTGDGSSLYTVIGHAPRHLDRNIALVGRIIEGIEHLTTLPRGTGPLGFYEDPVQHVTIDAIRVASELPANQQPQFRYLSTEGETFAKYIDARANRRDPFFIKPAGGADICNIPVPIRRTG